MTSEMYSVSCSNCRDRHWYVTDVTEVRCPDCGSRGEVTSREITIRGKWIFSGCGSVQEMVERLEERAEYLRGLDENGYELVSGGDDYWTLQIPVEELPDEMKPNNSEEAEPESPEHF